MEVEVDWKNEKKMDIKYVEVYFGEWNADWGFLREVNKKRRDG